MMTLVDIIEELVKIDSKILSLLEERVRICQGQHLNGDDEMEVLSLWLEEAAEKGLDEVKMDKVARLVIAMCRSNHEE